MQNPTQTELYTFSKQSVLQTCQSHSFAIAIYRLPYSNTITWIASSRIEVLDTMPILESKKGFIAASFEKDRIYFFADDFIAHQHSNSAPLAIEKDTIQLSNLSVSHSSQVQTYSNTAPISTFNDMESFQKLVQKAITSIEQGTMQKVVIARKKNVAIPASFSPLDYFDSLCLHFPEAFVSLTLIPGVGMWVGASPETLVSLDKDQVFKTVSLAGTQLAKPHELERDARWGQKEIEEQAFVSRYIINCLKTIRVREFEEDGPKTVRVGSLFHLKTTYLIKLNQLNFENFTTVMCQLLHPTSAVCGMPHQTAAAFIKDNELEPRHLYAGFIGPLNVGISNEIQLFVNIRTAKIEANHIILYAGAGITAYSNPQAEFIETEHKMQGLLNVLNKF